MRALVILACVACGRVNFDDARGDGGTAAGGDGALDAALPDAFVFGAFGAPQKIPVINDVASDDLGPSVDGTELEMYFLSPRFGGYTLWTTTRTAIGQPWSTPQRVVATDVNGPIEYDPDVNLSSTELYYGTNDTPNGIRRAERVSGDAWPGPGAALAAGGDRTGASLFANDTRMLIGRADATGGIAELARTGITQPWTFVREHPNLAALTSPGVRIDGLEMFAVDAVTFQMYRATRGSIDQEFGSPVRYLFNDPIDSLLLADPELSSDGRTLYFAADATGNDYDIYVSTR